MSLRRTTVSFSLSRHALERLETIPKRERSQYIERLVMRDLGGRSAANSHISWIELEAIYERYRDQLIPLLIECRANGGVETSMGLTDAGERFVVEFDKMCKLHKVSINASSAVQIGTSKLSQICQNMESMGWQGAEYEV